MRQVRGDGTGRHPFVLIEKDRFILTSIVNFIKAVRDPFIQQQVHSLVRFFLKMMVKTDSNDIFDVQNPSLEPVVGLHLLDLAGEIRNEPIGFRREAYIKTIFSSIVDSLDPNYLQFA